MARPGLHYSVSVRVLRAMGDALARKNFLLAKTKQYVDPEFDQAEQAFENFFVFLLKHDSQFSAAVGRELKGE